MGFSLGVSEVPFLVASVPRPASGKNEALIRTSKRFLKSLNLVLFFINAMNSSKPHRFFDRSLIIV